MKKNSQSIIIAVLVIIIVASASFFGGMKYQQSKIGSKRFGMGQFAANGQNMRFSGRNNGARAGFGGIVAGDVVGVDANSITVKLSDGSSKIVNLTNSTTYTKTDTASKADVTTGTKVAVIGAKNSDGSVTATSIELNPPKRMGISGKGGATPQVSK